MLDWLKPILGDGYNEEIDNKIAAEINKGFVAKADYDAAKDAQRTAAEALADANKALAEYKDTDIDGLRKSAEEWQAKAEQAEKDADARVAAVQFDAKLDSAIAAAHYSPLPQPSSSTMGLSLRKKSRFQFPFSGWSRWNTSSNSGCTKHSKVRFSRNLRSLSLPIVVCCSAGLRGRQDGNVFSVICFAAGRRRRLRPRGRGGPA